MPLDLPRVILEETFDQFRHCGAGRRECQALWVGPWLQEHQITKVVHPRHDASPVGFQLDDEWLGGFWLHLANAGLGVRVQVHTHPGAAYHSATDDAFPIVTTPGFLSLVIPSFALGPVGFEQAFLAQIDSNGQWHEVPIQEHLRLT